MIENSQTDWFQVWFDSPYYPVLYNHRDDTEAIFFLNHLIDYLKPSAEARVLDLACGRGRHAIYLNKLGFDVTGVDLSPVSIEEASKNASDKLHFYIHDMRKLLSTNNFDYVFNLFTSFGYFRHNHENELVIQNVAKTLKPGGVLVIDFLNVEQIRLNGSQQETRHISGIDFSIRKKIDAGKIIKEIDVIDNGQNFHFEERVSMLGKEEFEAYFKLAGLNIENVFGDYSLQPFVAGKSDRLIYLVRKP